MYHACRKYHACAGLSRQRHVPADTRPPLNRNMHTPVVQEDAPDNLCSRLWWRACNEARRRAVGPPGSDGKVFMHAYTSISLPDMDMLWPASKPNPTFFDTVSILVPLLVALGSSLWKLIGVRR